jgi:beta-glucosidase
MRRYFYLLLTLSLTAATAQAQDKPKYKDATLPVKTRVQDLVGRMTMDEKIAQLSHLHATDMTVAGSVRYIDEAKLKAVLAKDHNTGFVECFPFSAKECQSFMNEVQQYMRRHSRLGIPVFTVAESLHGSIQVGSTVFPQALALGSTFNTDLAYKMTTAISEELNAENVNQVLAPDVDVCRDLRWGRVEECIGEAPFLIAQMGIAEVRGYMDHHVSPMLKHYGAHGTPQGGINLASVTCGQRELLSVYLYPFEHIIKTTHPWAVMSSYDSWNGVPNSSSHYLMTDILRGEWGFNGYVYSDWGTIGMLMSFHRTAQNRADAGMQALKAGLDVEASDDTYPELPNLVEKGILDKDVIDQAVSRVLRSKFEMGLFDYKLPDKSQLAKAIHNAEHIALAKQIAEESIILMKNEQNILPLDENKIHSIALIGPNADHVQFGDYSWCNENEYGVTLLQAIKKDYGDKLTVNYAKGCDITTDNRSGLDEAVEAAKKSDVAVVVVGSAGVGSEAITGEGHDLSDLSLSGVQEELVERVASAGKPTIVVLMAGKPFAISWIKEHVPGIIVQWYPGEQGGTALAEMLFGKINPSGKLNFSFPQSTGHLPCFFDYLPSDRGFYHNPGSKNKPRQDYVFSTTAALWNFGHGLSYTKFDYLSATTQKEDYTPSDSIEISIDIRNSGDRDGMEVPQVYVRDIVSSVVTPIQELKGFAKVMIKKGETAHVRIVIPVSELALYNDKMERVVEPGAFELQIGSASDDIRIRKVITVDKSKEIRIPSKSEDKEGIKNNIFV